MCNLKCHQSRLIPYDWIRDNFHRYTSSDIQLFLRIAYEYALIRVIMCVIGDSAVSHVAVTESLD
jgi:hypothetical protein